MNAEPSHVESDSETDALLANKYHAMSDSQLLAVLRGDLSGQTETSLTIALAELETRTKIDWRDMAIAKKRVEEAIITTHKDDSKGSATFPLLNEKKIAAALLFLFGAAIATSKGEGYAFGVWLIIFFVGLVISSFAVNMWRSAGKADKSK